MPVMVVLPAVAVFIAADVAIASFALTGFAAIAAGVATGAIAGAVVGGISAAITGGDIGQGVLYGAVGGAVGGALAGYFTPDVFGLGSGEISAGVGNITSGASYQAGTGPLSSYAGATTSVTPSATAAATTASEGLLGGDMTKYALISGGAQMFSSGSAESPWNTTEEGTKAQLEASKESNAANNAAQLEAARLAAETSKANAALSAQITREGYTAQENQLKSEIAQRNVELQTPIEQANLARQRAMETASGLTLARKQAEGTA